MTDCIDPWPKCHYGCGWSFADESAMIEHEAQCAYKPSNIDAAEAAEAKEQNR